MAIIFTSLASGSSGNLYRLTDGLTTILIDPGLTIKNIRKALNFRLGWIDCCLLSHEHADHSKGAKSIIRAGIDLYAGEETIGNLGLEGANRIGDKEQIRLGTWTVKALPVKHDVPNMAYLMSSGENKCLYLIDTEYCHYKIPGLTHVFIGINYDKDIITQNAERGYIDSYLVARIMQSHMSLQTALEFFKAQDTSRLREIHVLHASDGNLDREKAKDKLQRLTGKLVVVH